MWWKLYLKIILAQHGSKKIGCIHLYVVQIKLENYIRARGISKLWQLLENKFRFEKNVKHLKGIDQVQKAKDMMKKTSKNKWKSFKKTLRKMEKKTSMEHQSPSLSNVAKRRHKVEKKFWKENLNLDSI